jgi:predicted DCC family thiol-disulfide oxidoreductase YuxK
MIRPYLSNPWQAAALGALLAAGRWSPWAFAGAALLFASCEIEAGIRRRQGPRWIPSEWPEAGAPLTILYDGTCALCVGSKKKLESWRTAGSMRFVPRQSPEAKDLAPRIPEEELFGAMHVLEQGRITSGADGWYRIMRLSPLTVAWVAWITPRAVARPVYGWIARNRYRWFGRVCEGGTCSLHGKARL